MLPSVVGLEDIVLPILCFFLFFSFSFLDFFRELRRIPAVRNLFSYILCDNLNYMHRASEIRRHY